jgi:hypothetical protein
VQCGVCCSGSCSQTQFAVQGSTQEADACTAPRNPTCT